MSFHARPPSPPGNGAEFDEIIKDLRGLFKCEFEIEQSRKEARPSPRIPTLNTNLDFYDEQIEAYLNRIRQMLLDLTRFPPHHARHLPVLEDFFRDGSFEQSVFIMTKFPQGNGKPASALRRVIATVENEIRRHGLIPRIALTKDYEPAVWDNVEVHLLGCSRGVAIVEDRYRKEFNPNIAKEWGWMRGMGKEVLFLVEDAFNHNRANWSGLSENLFSWESPREGIQQAIAKWLGSSVGPSASSRP